MSPTGCSRSLCALPVVVGGFVPYRLTVDGLCPNVFVRFFGFFWIKYKRSCTHVWGSCFSNISFTHWVFNSLFSCSFYRYKSVRTLDCPTKIAHVHPTVSTVQFDMRSVLGGGSAYCHLGMFCIVSFWSCIVLLYHTSFRTWRVTDNFVYTLKWYV